MGLLGLLLAQEVTLAILRAVLVAFCESGFQTHATGETVERKQGKVASGWGNLRRRIAFVT